MICHHHMMQELIKIREWCESISGRLVHSEKRLMLSNFLGHEAVRTFGIVLSDFSPPPYGDWGYVVRKLNDLSVTYLRVLVGLYLRNSNESLRDFQLRAMSLIRLFLEEALCRCVSALEGVTMKEAMMSCMLTFHNIEQETFMSPTMSTMGLFTMMTEGRLRDMAVMLASGTHELRRLPSYREAMSNEDMMHEIFSLLPVRTPERAITMTKNEIRTMIRAHTDTLRDEVEVPGQDGEGIFAGIFNA